MIDMIPDPMCNDLAMFVLVFYLSNSTDYKVESIWISKGRLFRALAVDSMNAWTSTLKQRNREQKLEFLYNHSLSHKKKWATYSSNLLPGSSYKIIKQYHVTKIPCPRNPRKILSKRTAFQIYAVSKESYVPLTLFLLRVRVT